MRITFAGGAGTVTGSKLVLEAPGTRLLVDCGLFQGFKNLRLLNRKPMPFDVRHLDGVVLTHAHLDHSGAVPLLVREGWQGPIHASPGSVAIAGALWEDAAHIQDEEATRANRKGYSRHKPALPIYSMKEVITAEQQLVEVADGERVQIGRATVTLRRAGHISGASSVLVELDGKRILFSGDLGRDKDPVQRGPDPLPDDLDVLVLEATYGDRHHQGDDPEAMLGEVIRRTVDRGGLVIIPAFAVGRTQRLLYHLGRLRRRGEIPAVPVYLNSPLAQRAMGAFLAHPEGHRLTPDEVAELAAVAIPIETREDSIRLNKRQEPAILIAGSGMATGGRVVHHLAAFGPDPRNTILLTGFQAGGTRGDRLQRGERELKMFGGWVKINAEVLTLHDMSAHADQGELLAWIRAAKVPPKRILLNHGEPLGADALRSKIEETMFIPCDVPTLGEAVELD